MKKSKKLFALLLSCIMVIAMMPAAVFADEAGKAVDTWDGTADTSWYTGHEADSEYHITTAEQLAGLAQLVNDKTSSETFKDKTIFLDNDLDLSGHQWNPIGVGSNFVNYFAGTFDGKDNKIMKLYHNYTGEDLTRNGLFGIVSDGGVVKNLMVTDADIVSNDCSLLAGILADWVNGGTVENCYTSGKIENNVGDKMVGGLIGQCTWSTQVKGCASDATVISTESDEDHVDTVGGLIGQWENSADSSSITDCWFGGSVSCNNIYSAVGGILGANFENFSGNKPGVIIKNCIVATKNITGAEPGNITWITAVVKTHVTDCIWPDTPPDGVTLDEETYPDNKGNYLAVAKLVVDWGTGTASADPTFDQSSCGTAVPNFTSEDVLTGLKNNAGAGVEWVAGINHPIFGWLPADYSKVDEAIAKADAIDKNKYKDFSAVEKAISDVKRDKKMRNQADVNAMAKAIEDAIAALQLKYSGGGSYIPKDNVTNKPVDKSTTADLTPVVKGDKAETTVDAKTADKIVDKAVENNSIEVVIDAAGNNNVASSEIVIPEKTVKELAEKTDANLVIKTDNGKVDLDRTALAAVAEQAGNTGFVRLIIETIKSDENICHVNLKLITSNGAVKDFKGGNVKVTIPLDKGLAAKELVCVYIDDNDNYTLVEGVLNADGTYTFTTGHFSEYAVMAKADAEKKIDEQLNTLIKEVNLKVRTSKTSKKNIKAVVSGDVKALTDAGYTVKYKFYRSTNKASKYTAAKVKDNNTYINTKGKKGTKYYYKAKALVYDGDKLVGQTVLTQCKYGVRTWSK